MSEPVPFPRRPVRPIARSFEDARWAELHRPEPAATAEVTDMAGMEARALRMGAVALIALPKPEPRRDGVPVSMDPAHGDCRCTAGTICRHNNACPRSIARIHP